MHQQAVRVGKDRHLLTDPVVKSGVILRKLTLTKSLQKHEVRLHRVLRFAFLRFACAVRNRKGELTPLSLLALGPDTPAVIFNDHPAKRET